MHDIPAMEVGDSLADVSKILFDIWSWNAWHFDFVEQRSPISVLQDHICDFSLCVDVDVNEFDDFGVGQSIVHHNFVFCDFIDLG